MRAAFPLILCAGMAQAVTLEFPGNAALQADRRESPAEYALPTGPWTPEGMPVLIGRGELRQQAWRIDSPGVTSVQLLQPLEAQLVGAGFDILFSCQAEGCGGFDFRFATDVMPAPDMYVDLGDFRFVAAENRQEGSTELVSLLVSRSSEAGYVQLTRIGAPQGNADLSTNSGERVRAEPVAPAGSFAQQLERDGRVVLADLAFETGSAQLGAGPFGSLEALADYLLDNPERTIALVGHTDAVGSLDGNIALSRRRAASVLERLVDRYDVPRRQLDAQGMGYLAPLATNLTEEGRTLNRRVEVIVTSTQ